MSAPSALKRSPSKRRFKVLSLIPFVAFMLVFAAYPLLLIVRMSFSDIDLQGGGIEYTFTGLNHFIAATGSALFQHSLWISLVFIVLSTLGSVVLGIGLAIVTDRAIVLQPYARNIMVWPAIIAPVVVSVAWILILNPQIGMLNKILTNLSLPPQAWLGSGSGAMLSIVIVDIWHWTPVVYLFIYSALKSIDASVFEAAQVDGASHWQTIRSITLPLLTPAIIAAIGVRVIMGVKVFDEMYLITRGGPGTSTTVVSLLIRDVVFGEVSLGYGSALSLLVVALVVVAVLIVVMVRKAVGEHSQ